MSYFFTHFLQVILPISLLLSYMWTKYSVIDRAKLIQLSLLAILFAYGLSYLPHQQIILLNRHILIALLLFAFLICQCFIYKPLAYCWHFVLVSIAFLLWLQDPNIAAITSTDVINTDVILHLFALLGAFLFCLLTSGWLYLLAHKLKISSKHTALQDKFIRLIWFSLLVGLLLLPIIGEILLSLMKLQIIELTKLRLSFVAKTSNIIHYNNYLSALMLLCITLYAGKKLNIPQRVLSKATTNIIQQRQYKAHIQQTRRFILWGIVLSFTLLSSQLYWDKVASQPPRLSSAQLVQLDEKDQIHIPIAQVNDGKLHRFMWISDEGKAVRFFIINRLADRLSLAVVFDACLLCGDQGYIMQDNQIICIGCGVYMFTPSIGKPGGCNPVPIEDWQQTEQHIIINKKNLESGLMLFSTVMEIEVKDPVDHSKLTNIHAPFKYSYAGKTYFFSNEQNMEKFRADPLQFINTEE